jgi:pyridoxine 4-dehydrogenase
VAGSQVALAWLLAHYDRMLLIPGTSSVTHLEENLTVDALHLGKDDLTTLDRVNHLCGSNG